MSKIEAAYERVLDAPPEKVFTCIADYDRHHPYILPESFSNMRVEQGGVGAGTIVTFDLKAGGRTRHYRTQIEEPEPGKILIERDLLSDLVTTFTVLPEAGNHSRVRFETVWSSSSGIGGFFERCFAPGMLQKLYAEEMTKLETRAQSIAN